MTRPKPTYASVTLLSCRACGAMWTQTLGEALTNPTGVVLCLRCKEPYTLGPEADTPAKEAKGV